MEEKYEIISVHPGGEKKVFFQNLDKKEATLIRDDWQAFFNEVYHEQYIPKLVSKKMTDGD